MSVLATLVVLGLLGLWAASIYNRLVASRKQVVTGWKQIDLQLKRRHDVIATLVSAIALEREEVEAVVAARNRAAAATGPADSARKEAALTQALAGLFALTERLPQPPAGANMQALREELNSTESALESARQTYNRVVTKYNAAISVVPNSWVAGFGNFRQAERFEESGSRT